MTSMCKCHVRVMQFTRSQCPDGNLSKTHYPRHHNGAVLMIWRCCLIIVVVKSKHDCRMQSHPTTVPSYNYLWMDSSCMWASWRRMRGSSYLHTPFRVLQHWLFNWIVCLWRLVGWLIWFDPLSCSLSHFCDKEWIIQLRSHNSNAPVYWQTHSSARLRSVIEEII